MKRTFNKLIEILRKYLDMTERNYIIVGLWIIGTYLHNYFQTYPYLYFFATKQSGKTRSLKLCIFLAKNGKMLALPKEAFIFRTTETTTFGLDEMETIGIKGREDLQLLLNTAYKKGSTVGRMGKTKDGQLVKEEFQLYAPIALANIRGINDVLNDRCLVVVLERSNEENITRKVEVWDLEPGCKELKKELSEQLNKTKFEFYGIDENSLQYLPVVWNEILDKMRSKEAKDFNEAYALVNWEKYQIEPNTKLLGFLGKLHRSKVTGRDFELWFPLCVIANFIGDDILNETIKIAEESVEERRLENISENPDTILLWVLTNLLEGNKENQYYAVQSIQNEMVQAIGTDNPNRDGSVTRKAPFWLTNEWVGRALKRLNVIITKRRTNSGIEVILNVEKIKAKSIKLKEPTLPTYTSQPTQPTLPTPSSV